MPDDFQANLEDANRPIDNQTAKDLGFEGVIKNEKELKEESEKEFLGKLKKKNKNYLIDLGVLERERIAKRLADFHETSKVNHDNLSDKMDEYDEVFRMVRKEVPGADEDMPNYRSPLSATTLEVVHANIMNVFFTPKDIMQVIPTEEGDVPKVKKLGVFGNWSMQNEMNLFEQIDRLFHSSDKNGECPYIVHWVKEYGVEIKREIIMDPQNPEKPMIDEDTKEPMFIEKEEPKLLYNAPKLEVFSRKDYIQPVNAIMDKPPQWEMRKIRLTYDQYLRDELQGKMYSGSIKDIKDWAGSDSDDSGKVDYEGDTIPVGKWEKEFIEFYGKLRITVIKQDKEDKTEEIQELEDTFIGIFNLEDQVLCSLRKNKFPLKMSPIGMDYFVPDDEGRRAGRGVIDIMDGPQKAYDALFNQYIFGTMQSNNPFGFFTPMGNQRNEPMKIRNGYMYPTSDPKSINIVKLPAPDQSIQQVLELVRFWAQMLFGISDYSAGIESKIDPSAPAKKAEIVVSQGNVRLNMIIKRKNKTLKDIFKRWFLLYKDNMPPNKFMRIAGHGDNPWKFEGVTLSDFALKSLPDLELTGNILNVNKTLEANKAIAIYNLLAQNVFFSPMTAQGLQALHALTKYLIDKLDETGLSNFLPETGKGDMVQTPEEENARFLQGDRGEPEESEDDVNHIRIHRKMLIDQTVPEEIRKAIAAHIQQHVKQMQEKITQQMVMSQMGVGQGQGGQNAVGAGTPQRQTQEITGNVPGQLTGVA